MIFLLVPGIAILLLAFVGLIMGINAFAFMIEEKVGPNQRVTEKIGLFFFLLLCLFLGFLTVRYLIT